MTPPNDTERCLSAKRNWWRRIDGTPLIVGKSKSGRIWGWVGDGFLDDEYDSLSEANARANGRWGLNAADNALAEAIRAMEAARPSSEFRPATGAEWDKLVAANEKISYAMYLGLGESKERARALAHMTMGGATGRLMLVTSFGAEEARHG